jgi:hypothetical protein
MDPRYPVLVRPRTPAAAYGGLRDGALTRERIRFTSVLVAASGVGGAVLGTLSTGVAVLLGAPHDVFLPLVLSGSAALPGVLGTWSWARDTEHLKRPEVSARGAALVAELDGLVSSSKPLMKELAGNLSAERVVATLHACRDEVMAVLARLNDDEVRGHAASDEAYLEVASALAELTGLLGALEQLAQEERSTRSASTTLEEVHQALDPVRLAAQGVSAEVALELQVCQSLRSGGVLEPEAS